MTEDWQKFNRAREGDQDAWRKLFEQHYPALVRMSASITGSLESGHDIAQESFVRLLRVRISHHSGTLKSFLSTIAYRLALKERARRIARPSSAGMHVADGSPSPLELAIRDETDRSIFRVIQSLSAEHREILVLHYFGGHSYEEIAGITSIPIGTVKSRMFYAVKTCRERLKEQGVFA